MYRNVLKIQFSNGQNSLENASELEIWVAEASINSVKWSKNVNFSSKFELKKFLKNGVQMSKYERILNFEPCVYLAYFRIYSHLKIVKCTAMY